MRIPLPGLIASCLIFTGSAIAAQTAKLGPFTDQTDIGTASTAGPGAAEYDDTSGSLKITGGGANIWAGADDFHYVWKKPPAISRWPPPFSFLKRCKARWLIAKSCS